MILSDGPLAGRELFILAGLAQCDEGWVVPVEGTTPRRRSALPPLNYAVYSTGGRYVGSVPTFTRPVPDPFSVARRGIRGPGAAESYWNAALLAARDVVEATLVELSNRPGRVTVADASTAIRLRLTGLRAGEGTVF